MGLIITVISLSMVLFQLPLGIYSDKMGRKKILILCLALMIGASFFTSIVHSFWLILVFQLFLGVGASGYHPVGISAAADLAPQGRVGSTMSVQAVGGSLGVALAPVIMGSLASYYNWRISLQMMAIVGLGVLFYGIYFIPETREREASSPDLEITKSVVAGIALLYFFRSFVIRGITTFMPTYFVEVKGLSLAGGGFTTGILLFMGALAQLIGGKVADRLDETKVILISTLVAALFLPLINLVPLDLWLVYLLLACLGLSLFIAVPATLSLVEKASSQGGYGKTFGANFTIVAISGMIAPATIGYIGDVYSLTKAFNLLPILLVIAAFSVLLVQRKLI